jgi:DNA-binding transcriptional MerR regulator
MREQGQKLSVEELAESVGVPVRTVRFYITQGLIPGPGARGKSATYGEEHLLRLRLVRRLSEQRVPLADIREQTSGLSLEEVRSLLEEEIRREKELQQAMSPEEYVSELLNRARSARRPTTKKTHDVLRQPSPPVFHALAEEASESLPVQPGETWYRSELVPGVELHVRADVEVRYRNLIERLLRVVGKPGNSESG